MVGKPWSLTANGISLTIRLTPKGGRDAIDGVDVLADGRPVLKIRVRAAASDGEANAALARLIAKAMDVPPRDVILAAGATGRIKRLMIAGDRTKLVATLENIIETREQLLSWPGSSRPSRLGTHGRIELIGIAGTSPAMTAR